MAFTIIDCEQRTPEWFAARLGCVTSSVVADVFANGRGKEPSKTRESLKLRLALERVTGKSQESGYSNDDMKRGIEMEPEALSAFEAHSGLLLSPVGFLRHDTLMAGASPDGVMPATDEAVVGATVDVKCPRATTHIGYLRDPKTLLADYQHQVRHQMFVSGAPHGYLVSYHPDFPPKLRLVVTSMEWNDREMAAHELSLVLFEGEVQKLVAELNERAA